MPHCAPAGYAIVEECVTFVLWRGKDIQDRHKNEEGIIKTIFIHKSLKNKKSSNAFWEFANRPTDMNISVAWVGFKPG
jgi:hypothetical protein